MNILVSISNYIRKYNYLEYLFKLEGYKYNHISKSYEVILRFRLKRASVKFSIAELSKSKEVLELLHPGDSFVVGQILALQQNKIILKNKVECSNDYDNFYVISPSCSWIAIDFEHHDLVFKHNVSGITSKVGALDITATHPLLRSISGISSFEIGYFVMNNHASHMFL